MESAWMRAQMTIGIKRPIAAQHQSNLAIAFIYTTIEQQGLLAKEVLAALATVLKLRMDLAKLLQFIPIDLIALRRGIAAEISSAGKYVV
jgi:hypothetical protein